MILGNANWQSPILGRPHVASSRKLARGLVELLFWQVFVIGRRLASFVATSKKWIPSLNARSDCHTCVVRYDKVVAEQKSYAVDGWGDMSYMINASRAEA